MTATEKLEITKEIDRIVHKYPRPDSSELFRSELEYLVEVVLKEKGEVEKGFKSFAIGIVENKEQFEDTFNVEEMQFPFVYCLGEDTQENRNAQVNSL